MSIVVESPPVGAATQSANGRVGRGIARTKSLTGFQVLATGSYVPDPVVTNEDLRDRWGYDPEVQFFAYHGSVSPWEVDQYLTAF